MTVVAVLHQPRYSLFRMFHQCLALSSGHQLVFVGNPQLAAPYFETLGFQRLPAENPADWLMDIVGGTAVREGPDGHLGLDLHSSLDGYWLEETWRDVGQAWVQEVNAQESASMIGFIFGCHCCKHHTRGILTLSSIGQHGQSKGTDRSEAKSQSCCSAGVGLHFTCWYLASF